MKRTVLFLVLAAACRSAPASVALTGADSPRAAVERLLAGAKAQDLQAVSAVFGDERGPLRDFEGRQEFERRALILIYCLRHDQSHIPDSTVGEGGRQVMQVDLTQGQVRASTRFVTARGPSSRWYVAEFDITTLQNAGFCRR